MGVAGHDHLHPVLAQELMNGGKGLVALSLVAARREERVPQDHHLELPLRPFQGGVQPAELFLVHAAQDAGVHRDQGEAFRMHLEVRGALPSRRARRMPPADGPLPRSCCRSGFSVVVVSPWSGLAAPAAPPVPPRVRGSWP